MPKMLTSPSPVFYPASAGKPVKGRAVGLGLRSGLALGCGLVMCCLTLGSAQAQFFGSPFPHPFAGPFGAPIYRQGPVYRQAPVYPSAPSPYLSPSEVFQDVIAAGYRPIRILGRNGSVLVVDAKERNGKPIRLIVDAIEGDILERHPQRRAAGEPTLRPKNATRPNENAANRSASLPNPPRRPATLAPDTLSPTNPAAAPSVKAPEPAGAARQEPRVQQESAVGPEPTTRQEPAARTQKDWAPLNSVPPASLE